MWMQFAPSVIHTLEDAQKISGDKKVHLSSAEPLYAQESARNKSAEDIFAGASTFSKKKSMHRPVMLTVTYSNELLFSAREIPKDAYTIVVNENTPVPFNDLNTAMKESMRIERLLIEKLERNESVQKSLCFLTTSTGLFYISKQRLLGEILKTQRKIERIRALTLLAVQAPLEAFIKKLCTLKVVADIAYPEESSRVSA
ncbi:uncharacterized protein NEMAJ01_2072 [Nematocida major]|uniref:uncharacterized protein n=1 Tax=Nematocida major TaxID=1912982 RepID=UPI002008C63C|nr:uncharacterized protein NEMAJ01_2072 [Nematocida major]KAH9387176.1 hypothetical protein NEMAJ01_2072 [Nematocida major]